MSRSPINSQSSNACARRARATLYSLAVILFAACGFSGTTGSGVVKDETRQIGGFSSISLNGVGHLLITQTGKESLTIRAEDNLLPLLESRVDGTVLHLGPTGKTNVRPTKTIEYILEVKSLDEISTFGAADVEVKDIDGKKLVISSRGAGSAKAMGKVESLEVNLSGAGSFDGEGLQAKEAKVSSQGVGSSVVRVSDQLDASVAGVGSVEYIGSPQVHQSVSGLGSVKKR